jgi:NPCBM/NEW2 domain
MGHFRSSATGRLALIASLAAISSAFCVSAAEARAPTARASQACSGYSVSHTSCDVGRRVLAACHENGSACRKDGVIWRCRRHGPVEVCDSGRRSVTRRTATFHAVYLDDLTPTETFATTPGIVSIEGVPYPHGLQMEVGLAQDHVEASYAIPAGAHSFGAVVGNDDTQTNEFWTQIPLIYEVFVDGRRAALAHAQGSGAHLLPTVSVTGAHILKLVVINEGDQGGGTRADWGDPLFS